MDAVDSKLWWLDPSNRTLISPRKILISSAKASLSIISSPCIAVFVRNYPKSCINPRRHRDNGDILSIKIGSVLVLEDGLILLSSWWFHDVFIFDLSIDRKSRDLFFISQHRETPKIGNTFHSLAYFINPTNYMGSINDISSYNFIYSMSSICAILFSTFLEFWIFEELRLQTWAEHQSLQAELWPNQHWFLLE